MIAAIAPDRFRGPVPRPRRHRAARRGPLRRARHADRSTAVGSPPAASSSPPAARPPCRRSPASTRCRYLPTRRSSICAERPDHLLILGGGPIGLEMADAFAGLGSRVTVVEAATIAGKEDPELVAGLRDALAARGVDAAGGREGGGGRAGSGAGPGRRPPDRRQPPAGRGRPAAEPRGARPGGRQRAGQRGRHRHRSRAAQPDQPARLSPSGDIADPQGIGPRAFTHVGSYHAGIVIRRALFRLPARIDYAALPRVTYTSPELAQVGMTEAEARAAGHARRHPALAAGRQRPRGRRAGHDRAGQAGRRRQPRARRRHPGAATPAR